MDEIVNTTAADLPQIFAFFDASVQYQERKGYPVWKNYDKGTIIKDIEDKLQFKIVSGQETVIVFSVRHHDKVIWRHMDNADSIYLHRIVVNPAFKGKRLFGKILDWAISSARRKDLCYIRMDTWAADSNIVAYYQTFGFTIVENYTTPDDATLPVHNRNLTVTLLEYKL